MSKKGICKENILVKIKLEEVADYLSDLICVERSTILAVMNIKDEKTRKRMYTTGIHDETLKWILLNHSRKNLGIHFATYYYDTKRFTINNVSTVNAFCIDIDYKKNPAYMNNTQYEIYRKPEEILEMLKNDNFLGLPFPNYVEIGNQLRLIYIFSEPVFFPKGIDKKTKERRKNMLTLYKRIGEVFCKRLNDEYDIYAEPQKINSYVRLPGSTNTKTDQDVYLVSLGKERFTMREFQEEYLPDLAAWYPKWKEKQKKHLKKQKKHSLDINKHNQNVLEDLKRIQQHYNGMGMDKGFRENMCYVFFLYANLFTGEDREKAMKMTHQFNMGFNHPLNNRMLTTSLRKSKIYYMKNQTILNYCNMDRKEGKKLGLTIAQEKGQKCKTSETPGYKKKKKMKASKGMDRKSQTEKRKQKVFYFLNSGLSIRKAAKSAGVSEQTVLNYKKEHKIIILKMQKTKEHNMERRRLIEMYLSDDLPAANSSTVSQKRPVVVYYNGIMPAMPETVSQEILLFPLCYLDIGLADAGPPGIVKIL